MDCFKFCVNTLKLVVIFPNSWCIWKNPENFGTGLSFFIYTQMREPEIKTSRFDQVFGGFEYEI